MTEERESIQNIRGCQRHLEMAEDMGFRKICIWLQILALPLTGSRSFREKKKNENTREAGSLELQKDRNGQGSSSSVQGRGIFWPG